MLLDSIDAIHLFKSTTLVVRRIRSPSKQDKISCLSKVVTYLVMKLVRDKKWDVLYRTVYSF